MYVTLGETDPLETRAAEKAAVLPVGGRWRRRSFLVDLTQELSGCVDLDAGENNIAELPG